METDTRNEPERDRPKPDGTSFQHQRFCRVYKNGPKPAVSPITLATVFIFHSMIAEDFTRLRAVDWSPSGFRFEVSMDDAATFHKACYENKIPRFSDPETLARKPSQPVHPRTGAW
jgi:hypothetical protein